MVAPRSTRSPALAEPQANRRLVTIAVEVFSSIAHSGDPLRHALTVLAATAFHDQQRFGFADPPWALIGMYTRGRLLCPPRSP